MSFQGIRKIRDARRESPNLDNYQLPFGKNYQLNLDSLPISKKQLQKTKDSDFLADSSRKPFRKSSLGINSSKEKEKRLPMMGNFLHINIDGLKSIGRRNSSRNQSKEYPKTQRVGFSKYNTQILDSKAKQSDNKLVSLASFNKNFVVGKGGFGKVWKVVQKKTNKIYAMKEMLKAKIISKKSVNSVMNQKDLLEKLKNPFLVNMVYAFQTKDTLFLIMDYCNRGDLRYHLGNRQKFKEEESRFFVACIIISIQYLHRHKVIHRDLKPQNLVFDQKGYLRVTDLGVSREVRPNNAEDTSGTPGYMAPEVICKMNHSYPVDYFALGVIAYEFIMGKRPYVGANRKEIRQKILAKQVQLDEIPPFGYSRQSVDFVNKLILRKPDQRLGANGIHEIKNHPWLQKVDWELLQQQKLKAPFLPMTVEQDYHNYKECISEDTEIADREQYNMLLRHPDTARMFTGYDFNINSSSISERKSKNCKNLQIFMHTTSLSSRRGRQ